MTVNQVGLEPTVELIVSIIDHEPELGTARHEPSLMSPLLVIVTEDSVVVRRFDDDVTVWGSAKTPGLGPWVRTELLQTSRQSLLLLSRTTCLPTLGDSMLCLVGFCKAMLRDAWEHSGAEWSSRRRAYANCRSFQSLPTSRLLSNITRILLCTA